MTGFSLAIDWKFLPAVSGELAAVAGQLAPDRFGRFRMAAAVGAAEAQALYIGYLLGEPIPGKGQLKKPAQDAVNGVTLEEGPPLVWTLKSDAKEAEEVEHGTEAKDLKLTHLKSPKARRAKDGSVYLIIPFRHGIPGTRGMPNMPKKVHALAKKLKASKALGVVGKRPNAWGGEVDKFGYSWGGKLTEADLLAAGQSPEVAKRLGNLYRFNDAKHSTYVTFRTMSSKSSGWIVPARPGLAPLATALQVSWDANLQQLQAAFRDDLMELLGLTGE